jgi:hypothetical protein
VLSESLNLPGPRRVGARRPRARAGRPDVAATALLANVADMDRSGPMRSPVLVRAVAGGCPCQPGRAAEAIPIARAYGAVADRSGVPGARALARRCSGLAGGSDEDLRAAVDMHAEIGNTCEMACTNLCIGQSLRRRDGAGTPAEPRRRSTLRPSGPCLVGARQVGTRGSGRSSRGRWPTASDDLTPRSEACAPGRRRPHEPRDRRAPVRDDQHGRDASPTSSRSSTSPRAPSWPSPSPASLDRRWDRTFHGFP